MKIRFAFLGLASMAAAVLLAQSLTGQPYRSSSALHLLRDSVKTLQGAYIMLPPEPVLPDVDFFEWNTTGTKLAVLTRSLDAETKAALDSFPAQPGPIGDQFLGIVDAKTQKVVWMTGADIRGGAHVWWPEGADFAVLETRGFAEPKDEDPYEERIFLINSGTGRAHLLGVSSPTSHIYVEPMQPGRVLITTVSLQGEVESLKVSVLDAAGQPRSAPLGLEKALNSGWAFLGWNAKFGYILGRPGRIVAVLLASGEVQALDWDTFHKERRLENQNLPEPSLALEERPGRTGTELWMKAQPDTGAQPAAMVCGLVEMAELSPQFSAVAYTSQRMLWMRRLVHMEGEKYTLLRNQAIKTDAMDAAKQAGLAVMIYSTDYDDTFPEGEFAEILAPYTKDPGIFDRFNFQIPRGSSKIKDPDKTPLGFVQTENGRATVYADGRVEWVDRRP